MNWLKMERTDTIIHIPVKDKLNINNDIKLLLEEASIIEINECSFVYNKEGDFYHPTEGDAKILGVSIPIKEMTLVMIEDLINLTKSNVKLTYYEKVDLEEQLLDYKKYKVFYVNRLNYIETLDTLERKGCIKTKESKSFIATDPRVFSFDNENWYEVDILGTSFGKEQTGKLVSMYNSL